MEKDQKMPDGTCHGRDLPDRGTIDDNASQYGAGGGATSRGFTDSAKIGSDTKSDK